MRLFVYGTLMRGEAAHRLLGRADFLAEAQTEPAYVLLDLGAYPGMVAGKGVVFGELYDVESEAIDALDAYEGEGFTRVDVALESGPAVGYLLTRRLDAPVIASGDWRKRQP